MVRGRDRGRGRGRVSRRGSGRLRDTLLSKSEIYNPRNALAPASLPNLKFKFPKRDYNICKGQRSLTLLLTCAVNLCCQLGMLAFAGFMRWKCIILGKKYIFPK